MFPVVSAQSPSSNIEEKDLWENAEGRKLLENTAAAADRLSSPLKRQMVALNLYHWFGIGDSPQMAEGSVQCTSHYHEAERAKE